jgi:hypothetical protein
MNAVRYHRAHAPYNISILIYSMYLKKTLRSRDLYSWKLKLSKFDNRRNILLTIPNLQRTHVFIPVRITSSQSCYYCVRSHIFAVRSVETLFDGMKLMKLGGLVLGMIRKTLTWHFQ